LAGRWNLSPEIGKDVSGWVSRGRLQRAVSRKRSSYYQSRAVRRYRLGLLMFPTLKEFLSRAQPRPQRSHRLTTTVCAKNPRTRSPRFPLPNHNRRVSSLPQTSKSLFLRNPFKRFRDGRTRPVLPFEERLRPFLGQSGLQRQCLRPGTAVKAHV
jgi:hypothetical protein